MDERDARYLERTERLAHLVQEAADAEGWLSYSQDATYSTALRDAIHELAQHLRTAHYEGDGCVDEGVEVDATNDTIPTKGVSP